MDVAEFSGLLRTIEVPFSRMKNSEVLQETDFIKSSGAGKLAQWQSICLVYARPWG
jgi:hypothetical protein